MPYVYLGYWVEGSERMAYKASFRPMERLGRDGWRRFGTAEPEAETHTQAIPIRQRFLVDA